MTRRSPDTSSLAVRSALEAGYPCLTHFRRPLASKPSTLLEPLGLKDLLCRPEATGWLVLHPATPRRRHQARASAEVFAYPRMFTTATLAAAHAALSTQSVPVAATATSRRFGVFSSVSAVMGALLVIAMVAPSKRLATAVVTGAASGIDVSENLGSAWCAQK